MDKTERTRTIGLAGPLILILLGVILLLNNFGVLGWRVWETLVRMWPVVLIALGVEIVLGRRVAWGRWIILALALAAVGSAILFSRAWGPGGDALYAEGFSEPLQGATEADLDIEVGVARLFIEATEDRSALVEGTVVLGRGEQLIHDFRLNDGTARFTLRTRRTGPNVFPFFGDRGRDRVWEVRLNPDIPVRIKLSTGVGASEIDLGRSRVTELDVSIGVGKTTVVLPQTGRVDARIRGGVGATMIYIPGDVAARVRVERGIGKVSVNGDYGRLGDDEYVSPGFDTAADRVDLRVNVGIGEVIVREL